jgi:hypothetical protein
VRAAVEHHFNGTTGLTGITGGTAAGYDSSKTMLSSLLRQPTGANVEDRYISPKASALVNIPEVAVGSQHLPHVYKWSNNIYWVFAVTNAGAAATRTITLFEFDSSAATISYKGYITLSGTTITSNKQARAFRSFVYEHTTGTVSTSGSSTTITGSGTGFQSERIAVGARIGFGTTDPTAVTTWYEITAIASDTSLTISGAVNLSAGTSYVIEEIRIAIAVTSSATIINTGIHLIKGLNYGTFTNGGTTIPEATTVDNIRASYLLTDAVFAGASTATFTVTIATPAVFTIASHGLNNGDAVVFTTTGALPTGLTTTPGGSATVYYVINAATNTFNVSTTLNGSAVATSGTQSGTHTIHHYPRMNPLALAEDAQVSTTDHSVYLVGGPSTTSVSVIKYNIRAALTVGAYGSVPNIASGTSASAFVLKTATLAVTGTVVQLNSGRVFTVNHGAASGVKCLYFNTTTRVYRVPIASITSGSTNHLADAMIEVPPGSTTTYTALSAFSQVDYSSAIDRLLITNSTSRLGTYITTYNTAGDQFEKYIGSNLSRVKLTTTPTGASDGLFPQAVMTIWNEDGWLFAIPSLTTSGQNWLYIMPMGVDAYYNGTSNQHIITPKLATPNATSLQHVYLDHMEYAGTYGLGFPVETYRLWYRVSGIDDNSGSWTEVPLGADLQNVSPSDYIQFKIAFDILGEICVPTRIYSICCTYEDSSQDSHYQPSLTKSVASSRIFAWKQVTAWGTNIPNLQIRLYNADTGFLVLDDTVTLSASGTWQYSTDGSTWNSWSASADTVGNYIRYTATSLPNNITVKALLTQA